MLCQIMSPYQLNPCNLNPLKRLLEEIIDFRTIRQQTAVKLFLCATNVRTCKLEVFRSQQLTADHVLASSCLPFSPTARPHLGNALGDAGDVRLCALLRWYASLVTWNLLRA
jgi:NTE family protein